jgi:hypothetical protein
MLCYDEVWVVLEQLHAILTSTLGKGSWGTPDPAPCSSQYSTDRKTAGGGGGACLQKRHGSSATGERTFSMRLACMTELHGLEVNSWLN